MLKELKVICNAYYEKSMPVAPWKIITHIGQNRYVRFMNTDDMIKTFKHINIPKAKKFSINIMTGKVKIHA